jgi:predicted Zn-dependent protease
VIWRMLFRLACALTALSLVTSPAMAQRISFIRDAEVENTIRAFATPVFTVAGLNASDIGVHIINDRSLNAFVANGLNLFINSGLLIRSQNPGQVIGVIAHETGHIAGGHLARIRDGMEGAMYETIVAMVLGAAIMAAGGGKGAGAGAGVMSAGQQVGLRSALQYSREMESQADQAGCNFLERAGLSARGLMEFLSIIQGEELLSPSQQDPYVRTHPITTERVDFIRNFVAHQRHADAKPPAAFDEMFVRMRAKLMGYLEPSRALAVYKETDTSLEARYGRAIAYSRRPDYPRAFAAMDDLLRERPDDPYFLEAKAQMLMESGKVADSVPLYGRAVDALPDEPLLLTELAQAQLGTEKPELVKPAIANLEKAKQRDAQEFDVWRLLAVAYGRDNQLGLAALSQAELESLRGQKAAARTFADRAQKLLRPGTAPWQRADDIKNANTPRDE